MKYIKVPEPITLVDDKGEQIPGSPIRSLYDFVNDYMLNDKVFAEGFKSIMAGGRIQSSLKETEVGGICVMDDADYILLRRTVEAPSRPMMPPIIARQYVPFMQAIVTDAAETKEELTN